MECPPDAICDPASVFEPFISGELEIYETMKRQWPACFSCRSFSRELRKNRILEKKKKRGHKSSSKNGKNVLLQLDEIKFFLFIKLSSIVMYLFDINKLSWKGFQK